MKHPEHAEWNKKKEETEDGKCTSAIRRQVSFDFRPNAWQKIDPAALALTRIVSK